MVLPLEGSSFQHPINLDDSSDDDMQEHLEGLSDDNALETLIDLTEDEIFEPVEEQDVEGLNAAFLGLVLPGETLLGSADHPHGYTVKPGQCYEILPSDDLESPGIFKVTAIIRAANSSIMLKGILMKRHRDIHLGFSKTTGKMLHSILPLGKNELCMYLETTPGRTGSPLSDECLKTIPIEHVICEREVIFTNKSTAEMHYLNYGRSVWTDGSDIVEDHGMLLCRWKFVREIDVRRKKVVAYHIAPLREGECDQGMSLSDVRLRQAYGTKTRKTDYENTTKRYTVGDVFAGGGGSLRGAKMAGLIPKWALDCEEVAIETLRANFPEIAEGHLLLEKAEKLADLDLSLHVDCLHISCPCQGHSRANRGLNPDRDFANNALIMVIGAFLEKCCPRMITLEQTNHIETKNEGFFFRKMIYQLTAAGYGARWKVCEMREHNVPQDRKRLMVMGFCPGEVMPDWPEPTNGPGLEPYKTVRHALADIHPGATHNDIEKAKRQYRRHPRPSLPLVDLDQPLPKIIKTDGAQFVLCDMDGQFYVPTPRQQLRLMGFPDHHTLAGRTHGELNKQIGNAVPPEFQAQMMRKVIEALRKSDREIVRGWSGSQ